MQSNIKCIYVLHKTCHPASRALSLSQINLTIPYFSRREVKRGSARRLKTCIRLFEMLTQAADFVNKEHDDFFCIFANSGFLLGSL